MLKRLKFIIKLVILIIIIAGLWYVWQISRPVKLDGAIQFTIEEGEGVKQINYHLKEQGLIKNSFAFELYTYLKNINHKFIAGKYNLSDKINIKNLIKLLTTPKPGEEWSLTVIEGWTIKDIAYKLENLGKYQAEELMAATGIGQPDNTFTYDISNYDFFQDKPATANLEGYLFPDTYRYFMNAAMADIITKMLDNFDAKLTDQMRQDIKAQDKTIFAIITLASIIEREAKYDEDRGVVSGIFWKRLDSGIALQADSTVNYITGKKTPALSLEDTKIDSLYNTYLYPGLPPGPISNPGLTSIKAAIYPQESDYWFFLTDPAGTIHYAKNFEEHKNNKIKYLQ